MGSALLLKMCQEGAGKEEEGTVQEGGSANHNTHQTNVTTQEYKGGSSSVYNKYQEGGLAVVGVPERKRASRCVSENKRQSEGRHITDINGRA